MKETSACTVMIRCRQSSRTNLCLGKMGNSASKLQQNWNHGTQNLVNKIRTPGVRACHSCYGVRMRTASGVHAIHEKRPLNVICIAWNQSGHISATDLFLIKMMCMLMTCKVVCFAREDTRKETIWSISGRQSQNCRESTKDGNAVKSRTDIPCISSKQFLKIILCIWWWQWDKKIINNASIWYKPKNHLPAHGVKCLRSQAIWEAMRLSRSEFNVFIVSLGFYYQTLFCLHVGCIGCVL